MAKPGLHIQIIILSDGHSAVLLLLIFDYSTGDCTDPWLCFKTKRSSFDEWGFYRQNYMGCRPENSQEKPQNCNEKTQLGSQIKYCGFS